MEMEMTVKTETKIKRQNKSKNWKVISSYRSSDVVTGYKENIPTNITIMTFSKHSNCSLYRGGNLMQKNKTTEIEDHVLFYYLK